MIERLDLCYEGWQQSDGNSSGSCCCNCKYQMMAVGHPWNKKDWLKTPITEHVAYACCSPDTDRVILFETEHGMCEMHEWRTL